MSTATGLFPVKTWTPSSSTTPSSSLDALNEAIRARVQARKSAAASGQGPAKRQRAAATAPTLPRNASSRKGGRISASSRKPPPKSIERSVGAFTSLLAARDLLSSGRHRKEPKPVVVESASSSESSSEEEEVEEAVPAKAAESAAVRAAAELAAEWGLLPELVDVVRQQKLATFFPIQRLAIRPIVNDGVRDVCVAAPTGSGKTLVYVTCVLNSLARRVVVRTRALIVVPTRDLAPSCVEVAHTLSLDLHLDQSQPQQSCASYPATTVAAAVRRGANLAASAFALPINWQTTGAAGQEDGSPSYVDQQAIAIGATVASCVPLPRVGIRLVLNIRVLGGLDATLRGAVDGSGQRKLTNASIEVLVRDRLRAAGLKGVIAVAGFALA